MTVSWMNLVNILLAGIAFFFIFYWGEWRTGKRHRWLISLPLMIFTLVQIIRFVDTHWDVELGMIWMTLRILFILSIGLLAWNLPGIIERRHGERP